MEAPEMPYDQNRSVEPSGTIDRQPPATDDLSRVASRSNPRNDLPKEVLRPVAFAALADEYSVGNPYHTPTESQSSNESDFSGAKTGSSRSSPPLSDTSSLAPRKGSKTANMDNVMNDLQNSFRNIQPTSDSHSGPKSTFVAPEYNRSATFPQPESPMDPSFPSRFGSKNAFNAPSTASPLRQAPQRAQTVSNKGFCKGCQEPIRGKSVSSADGRLTGRYHKHCFVCKSCRAPFETAEFYVLKDQPYCERHYHKLNNSLCQSCDQGIEGQYLETDRKQKFHPRCLSCHDCHQQLHEDYFELNGKIYCERDALRLAQRPTFPGSGRKNPERRTTRLMMMI
ncbi:MAG: hypothetical protein M1824_005397 [Vezdaea acicularis]|nr:MAG: hypothetical protein M1824_005397 [Vezdaea acicularis]